MFNPLSSQNKGDEGVMLINSEKVAIDAGDEGAVDDN